MFPIKIKAFNGQLLSQHLHGGIVKMPTTAYCGPACSSSGSVHGGTDPEWNWLCRNCSIIRSLWQELGSKFLSYHLIVRRLHQSPISLKEQSGAFWKLVTCSSFQSKDLSDIIPAETKYNRAWLTLTGVKVTQNWMSADTRKVCPKTSCCSSGNNSRNDFTANNLNLKVENSSSMVLKSIPSLISTPLHSSSPPRHLFCSQLCDGALWKRPRFAEHPVALRRLRQSWERNCVPGFSTENQNVLRKLNYWS